ncbi:MAG: hypothetical protein A2452_10555 [Candidatus Firestonebacteria bacterium RIFOXYC2_FULL_39_67]|nr:MAG: hypothetical protein A2452_10555 [Candidatus Firestonebacteria bacterium RIFOXYC2_FULL_39_67]
MPKKKYAHLFIDHSAISLRYTSPSQIGKGPRIPERDRKSHAEKLLLEFDSILQEEIKFKQEMQARSIRTRNGTYLQFDSKVDCDLLLNSLEDMRIGIRLCSVKQSENGVRAMVYVPSGKENNFIKKIVAYRDITTKYDKPKNSNLVNSIEDVSRAFVKTLWMDPEDLMPTENDAVWVEAWLSVSADQPTQGTEMAIFNGILEEIGIERKDNQLIFPERVVVLIKASGKDLSKLMQASDLLAEFRIGQEPAGFWTSISKKDQTDWVNSLLSRVNVNSSKSMVCLLDTGVNSGHPLLAPVLDSGNCLTINASWGTDDYFDGGKGHGTLMAGIIAYGDIEQALITKEKIQVSHKICSVKILPRTGINQKELYGDITQQAVSRAEISNPDIFIVYCMAITSKENFDKGRPSSWSGTIDNIAFGEGKDQKLIIVSAGNINTGEWDNYFENNKITSVHNPAQAWNALTVGAYTEKNRIIDSSYNGLQMVAPFGGLSPFSTTSFYWDDKWPIKPEVVFEGGNLFKDASGNISEHEDLSLLSTSESISSRYFDTINATSAATAKAAWFASQIRAQYNNAWPETIRGLIVHSASWNDEMKNQIGGLRTKNDYRNILRVFGYGKPDINKALYCSSNLFTIVMQEVIQPFEKSEKGYKMKDMNIHHLPWPKDILLAMGEMDVKLRITLSFYIQPAAGERAGWKNKYRYASHGLRFDLNNETEDENDFKKRINVAVREQEEEIESSSGSERWDIGSKNRRIGGSVYSDIWRGTAAQVASCNMLAVYPVIGWWREQHNLNKVNSTARYSLIVSLETPETDTDIYAAVKALIPVPIEIPINTNIVTIN